LYMLNETLLPSAGLILLSPGNAVVGNSSPDSPTPDPLTAKATEFSTLVRAGRADEKPPADSQTIHSNRAVTTQRHSALSVQLSGKQLKLSRASSDGDRPIPETDESADAAASTRPVKHLQRLLVPSAAIEGGPDANNGYALQTSLLEPRPEPIARSIPEFSIPIEAYPNGDASQERQEGGPLTDLDNQLILETVAQSPFGARPPLTPRQQFSPSFSLAASGVQPVQAASQVDDGASASPDARSTAQSIYSPLPDIALAEPTVTDETSRSGPLVSGIVEGRSSLLSIEASVGQGARLSAASSTDPPQPFRISLFAKANEKDFELRLDPPDLGSVTLVFFEDDAGVQRATITSERSDTLDLLRRHSDVLQRELARAGAGDVEFGFHQAKQDDRREDRPTYLTSAREGKAPLALFVSAEPVALTMEPGRIDRLA
jgi:flagellar hook-length control protein FliK